MTSLPLVFDAPRRGLPPRHLADLTAAERAAAVAELGEQPFRAKQLAHHYFARLSVDPAAMTDIPAAARERLAAALMPPLLTEVRALTCDDGTTRKTLWRAHDGTLRGERADALPGPRHRCASPARPAAGWRARSAPPVRAACSATCPPAEIVDQVRSAAAAMRDGALPGGPGRLSNVVFMGMGEPLANYKRVVDGGAAHHRPGAGRPRHLAALRHGLHGRAGARPSASSPTRACRSASRCRCTPPTTSCATRSCRSTTAGRSPRCSTAARHYADTTGRRVSIEYALIRDVNDQPWRADLLGKLLRKHLGPAGARQPDPAEPDAGQRVGRQPEARASDEFVRPGQRRGRRRALSATPAARRSPRPAGSWPPKADPVRPVTVPDGPGRSAADRAPGLERRPPHASPSTSARSNETGCSSCS